MKNHASFWLKEVDHFKNSLEGDFECDVVIVGAGISGISTAYHLLHAGLKVAVFDRDVVGGGSTGNNAGFLAASAIFELNQMIEKWGEEKGNKVYEAILYSISSIEQAVVKNKIDCDYKKHGALSVGSQPSHFSYLEDEFECLQDFGTKAKLIKPGDPRIPIKGVYGALKTFEDASFNPVKFLRGLCNILIAQGVNIFTHTEIVSMKKNTDAIILKTKNGQTIKSKYVVLASNGFSLSGKKDPTTVEYTSHIAVTKPIQGLEKILEGELIWNTDEIYNYLRPLSGNRIIVGGEDSWFGKINQKHNTEKFTKKRNINLLKKLQIFFPELPIEIETSWVGTLICPLDGLASIKEDGHTFTLITECMPFGWLLGQIVMEKITKVDSKYEELFVYKRDYGFFQNLIIHAPLPQNVKNLIIKLGQTLIAKINY